MLVPGLARPGRWSRSFLASAAWFLCVSLILVTLPQQAVGQEGSDCETSHFDATEVPTAIPDPGSVTSSLVVPEGKRVDRAAVSVSVSHPFVSDLRLELVSPQGKRVLLAEAVGIWGDDLSGTTFSDQATTSIVSSLPPFSGQHRPVETLAAFSGSARAGTWTLEVADLRARYPGSIESWGLDLVSCADTTSNPPPAGAPDPPPLPDGVPVGSEPVEGKLITVTSTSDLTNGDVSTVDALEANPGPDGISLRETIEATNNDPGTYTVHFDSQLAGATLGVSNELPVLRGGGVFIDGDVDGNGRPDVSLVGESARESELSWGLNVASSDNRLHGLGLQGFAIGVVFTAWRDDSFEAPLLKDRTFARNVVSGLVLESTAAPIAVYPTYQHQECEPSACRTGSRWLDTRIVGNSIDSRRNGAIWVGWINDNGDTQRRLTVAGNEIRTGPEDLGIGLGQGNGIDLTVGTEGQRDNQISGALVAYNSIDKEGAGNGLQVLAGFRGRSGNVIEDVRMIGNVVRFLGAPRRDSTGVTIFVSDACWGSLGGDCENFVRHVEFVGNVLQGPYVGVRVAEPCCNNTRSTVTDVQIVANVINSVVLRPTEFEAPWGVVIGGQRPGVSNIRVDSNTIVQSTMDTKTYGRFLTAGGIVVVGGLGKARTSVRNVRITNNRVATKLIGILLMGGGPSGERSGQDNAVGNRVFRVEVRGNVVTRAPTLVTRWFSNLRGISLIGGLGGPARAYRGWRAKTNSVACVTLKDNAVAGSGRGVAVLANLGVGTSRNIARLGGC